MTWWGGLWQHLERFEVVCATRCARCLRLRTSKESQHAGKKMAVECVPLNRNPKALHPMSVRGVYLSHN